MACRKLQLQDYFRLIVPESENHLTAVYDAAGNVTSTFEYDASGNMNSTTDAAGFARSFNYDSNGNQTGTSYNWTDPEGTLGTKTVSTTTIYDAAGQVVKTVDPEGNISSTVYNEIGKPEQTIDKLGNSTFTIYDDRGNVIETQYPDGTISRTVYDANGRGYLSQDRHHPGNANLPIGSRSVYDSVGRV